MVEFNELECCALCEAFENNPELVDKFDEFIPNGKMEIYQEILINTSGMRFKPTGEVADVYRSFAVVEIGRIKDSNQNERLSCGHTVGEHAKSLGAVVEKMNSVAN